MHYKQFIQQYVIYNHGGAYGNDNETIETAIRVADNLVRRGLLTL